MEQLVTIIDHPQLHYALQIIAMIALAAARQQLQREARKMTRQAVRLTKVVMVLSLLVVGAWFLFTVYATG